MVAMGARQTNVLATLSGGLAVLLLVGSVASWMVFRRGHNKALNPTGLRPAG
jgi:hypothetical protein